MKELILIVIFLSLVFEGCMVRQYQYHNIEGTYIAQWDNGVELILTKEKYLLIERRPKNHPRLNHHCDTLSHGGWDFIYPGFLELSSHAEYDGKLSMNVKEKKVKTDSITFLIKNPLEKSDNNLRNYRPIILYQLFMNLTPFIESDGLIFIDSSIITYPKPQDKLVSSFHFDIHLKPGTYIWHEQAKTYFQTIEYQVKNKSANYFEVEIPDLTGCYISTKRLFKDYVKIQSKNRLIWDGDEYVRVK
ncbi:MAG: hypothetical protein AAFP92_07620 [Bacteroidota bacterium]